MSPAEPELPFGCGGWVWKQKATLFGGSGLRTQLLSLAAADAPCSRQLYACTHWDGTHHPHRSLSPEKESEWKALESPKALCGMFSIATISPPPETGQEPHLLPHWAGALMAQRALAVPWEDAAGRQWEVKIRRLCLSRADPAGSTRLCFLYSFQQFINFTAKQSHLFEGEVSYSKSLLGRKQQMILTRRGCLKGCRCYCPGGALLGPRAPRAHPASLPLLIHHHPNMLPALRMPPHPPAPRGAPAEIPQPIQRVQS